jgi:hypothetical protein
MHIFYLGIFPIYSLLQLVNVVEAAYYPPDAVDLLAAKGLVKLAAYQAKHDPENKCTVKNAIKRREWYVCRYFVKHW